MDDIVNSPNTIRIEQTREAGTSTTGIASIGKLYVIHRFSGSSYNTSYLCRLKSAVRSGLELLRVLSVSH